MSISDIIENFIKDMMTDNTATLKRNELADKFNCVPSQINYVISTRFTSEQGYIVESRRGGGGYITIRKINVQPDNMLMHVVNSIGNEIDFESARVCIKALYEYDVISKREANIIISAISDRVLTCERPLRDKIRANMIKNMLLYLGK
ncbi:MAG: CtsR family transcriptional regulator [Clostridia bacterium]|nr:CtsR family transcriptional regulator [Clostridia bacterium]